MTDANGIAIRAKGLSKWFGEVMAVNNLHIELPHGVIGLLGPNGAGKTTFIKLALGLYAPSRGEITVLGAAPRNNMEVLRRIGHCPEADKFYETMSGFEFVCWMNRFWGMKPAEAARRAREALELLKMTSRMNDRIEEYSRGMRQRVKIAQSLSTDPELLFLDEPMTGLDPEGREELFTLIRKLGDEGRTIVFSTHVLHEVERVTNDVLLLYNGCVLAQGNVHQIRDLIDEHPHAVTIECSNPRSIADRFVGDDTTLNVEFHDGKVTIRTRNAEAFYQKLNGLILEEGIAVESIVCPDDNLQSVFDYLVR